MIINTVTDRDKRISLDTCDYLANVVKSRKHCRMFPEIVYLRDLKIQYPRAHLDQEHEVRIFCQMDERLFTVTPSVNIKNLNSITRGKSFSANKIRKPIPKSLNSKIFFVNLQI